MQDMIDNNYLPVVLVYQKILDPMYKLMTDIEVTKMLKNNLLRVIEVCSLPYQRFEYLTLAIIAICKYSFL